MIVGAVSKENYLSHVLMFLLSFLNVYFVIKTQAIYC